MGALGVHGAFGVSTAAWMPGIRGGPRGRGEAGARRWSTRAS